MRQRFGRGVLVMGLVVAIVVAGCGTGDDAVRQGGSFEFVSPGGKTVIFYDPPQSRGVVQELTGPDVMRQGATVRLSDFVGQVVV